MSNNPKLLIVGAGPTGLALAHELARAGVDCRLVDKTAHRTTQSRAIAIHPRTIETLELMGVADAFLAAGQRITGVDLNGNGGSIAHVAFASLETRYPYVLGVPQDETERILEEHVAKLGIAVERGTELTGLTRRDGLILAQLRGQGGVEEVAADWVLGCDGAHSAVRDQLGVGFAGATYAEHFVLADIIVAGDLDHNKAAVWLAADGAVALFPLPHDRWRLIVTNAPPEWQAEPKIEQCQTLLDQRGLANLRLADPRWTAVFRIHRRIASRFRQDHAFLLGDAGHIHSPVGGQGMNIGIQDAFNLAWKLALVGGGASPALLDSYEAERRPIDEAVLRQTDRATRMVALHGPVTRFIRDHLIALAAQIPAVVEKLGEGISGIAVNYRHSPIVAEHALGAAGPHAGDRAPDALVADPKTGGSRRLFELFGHHRHVLLMVGQGGAPPALPQCGQPPIIVRRVAAAASGGDLGDPSGEVAARYGSAAIAYLIRPDGYVGMRCAWSELSQRLPPYLARLGFGADRMADSA
jgi:2-polyprenyl-6-methoxyphenol hydroxylase-like FAD-dependent oxidoreductase